MPEAKTTDHGSAPGPVLRGREAVRDAFAALAGQAHRELALFAVQPDPYFLDTEPFVSGLAAFVARHRQNRARLLVGDPTVLSRDHTRLVGTLHRLSDAIHLREIAEHDRGRSDLFLLVDRRKYLVLADVAAIEGRAGETRREAIELSEAFEAMWERAVPASLRPLGL